MGGNIDALCFLHMTLFNSSDPWIPTMPATGGYRLGATLLFLSVDITYPNMTEIRMK